MRTSNGRFRVLGFRESADKILKKNGVFDLKGSALGFMEVTCDERDQPCRRLVILYAKMGLHRYNLLQGTKFQLNCVKKFIQTVATVPVSYYITLDAMDPTGGSSLQTFQTKVSGGSFGQFILTCNIARIRDERRDFDQDIAQALFRTHKWEWPPENLNIRMPEWPPENPFDNYYRLKESELQDNDWIRLYLELAVATPGATDDLPEMEIVSVALGDDGLLNANNATLYIRYNEAALGKEVSDRIAIVRRSFNEDAGCFILVGQTHESSEIIPKNVANEDTGCLSLKRQNQSSETENKRIKLHLTGLANQISSPLADPNQLADAAEVSMEN